MLFLLNCNLAFSSITDVGHKLVVSVVRVTGILYHATQLQQVSNLAHTQQDLEIMVEIKPDTIFGYSMFY